MAVRKKTLQVSQGSDKMISPQVLERVKKAISNLPDEGADMSTEEKESNNEATEKPAAKKKVAKKSPAATKKKVVKAASKKAVDSNDNLITLAELCKSIKMEPRTARQVLRKAELSVEGGRWAWKKGSGDVKKVETLLKKHAAGE